MFLAPLHIRDDPPTFYNTEMASSAEQTQILELIKKKNKDFKARITRFNHFMDKQKDNPDEEEIEAKLAMLKEVFANLNKHHEENSIHLHMEIQEEELIMIEETV